MKKLLVLIPLLVLSSCLPDSGQQAYDIGPPVCYANGDPQPTNAGSLQTSLIAPSSYKVISASFAPADFGRETFGQQVRLKLNGDVVYNSCRPVDIDGLSMQNSTSFIYFRLDLDQNEDWRGDYFHEDGTPKRWGLEMQIDTKRNCGGESWQPVLSSTAALLNWQESSGPCSLGGYYVYLTSPIPLDVPTDAFSDPQ